MQTLKRNFRYVIFHKPYGVTCQFSGDDLNLSKFKLPQEVYSVGRLDKDSEGLLLLTNDGALNAKISHPKFKKPKIYLAQVEKVPLPKEIEQLERGVNIKGYQTRPCQVERLSEDFELPPRDPPIRQRKSIPTAWLKMTLTEGKNRQVRRMTAAVGHPTLRLIRIAIGPLELKSLASGAWRDLTELEKKSLFAL